MMNILAPVSSTHAGFGVFIPPWSRRDERTAYACRSARSIARTFCRTISTDERYETLVYERTGVASVAACVALPPNCGRRGE
jgi:hypothetical protein